MSDEYEQLMAAKRLTEIFKTIQDAQLQHIKLSAFCLFPTATKLPEVQFSIEKHVFTINLPVTKEPTKSEKDKNLKLLETWTRHITWEDATIGVSFIQDVQPSSTSRQSPRDSKPRRTASRRKVR